MTEIPKNLKIFLKTHLMGTVAEYGIRRQSSNQRPMLLSKFIKRFDQTGRIYLKIKARPGAALTAAKQILQDKDDELIKIDLAAPAVKGRANLELVKFLAGEFATERNNVKIIGGAGDRLKLVKIVKNVN